MTATPQQPEFALSAREICENYAAQIVSGQIISGKWMFAAARRYLSDLERTDVAMDWDELEAMRAFFHRLPLVADASGQPFDLAPWQLWCLSNLWCWRYPDGRKRISTAMLQVGRGNGKTTLMAGLALYDIVSRPGARTYCIANRKEQAELLLETARAMANAAGDDLECLQYSIERKEADCLFTALPAKKSSLDGLTPSLWIADEAAEYRDNFLEKLESALPKRKSALGVIISTPGDNPDNLYGERIARAEAVLKGESEDDSSVYMLYGIDDSDQVEDESNWEKANPGLSMGQPDIRSIRQAWGRSKATPVGRSTFARYHLCRTGTDGGGWLDMELAPKPTEIDWAALRGNAAWGALDLSKSLDLTALVIAVPLDDGRVALRGHYWWPSDDIAKRELDYRLPIRNWAARGKLTLCPGRTINYESVMAKLQEVCAEFQIQKIAFDPWGSKYFAEQAANANIPLAEYRQTISNIGPGCQLWQDFWAGGRFVVGDDPILMTACRAAIAIRDANGNIRIDKRKHAAIVDPLAAAVMAVHCWGGQTRSGYEDFI